MVLIHLIQYTTWLFCSAVIGVVFGAAVFRWVAPASQNATILFFCFIFFLLPGGCVAAFSPETGSWLLYFLYVLPNAASMWLASRIMLRILRKRQCAKDNKQDTL
jgi:energy-coupling factor transporter transmembrane protein EcfT